MNVVRENMLHERWVRRATAWLPLACLIGLSAPTRAQSELEPMISSRALVGEEVWSRQWSMDRSEVVAVTIQLEQPSGLPPNGRVEVSFDGPALAEDSRRERPNAPTVRATNAWEKVLHALDPDLHVMYKAPVSGQYTLRIGALQERPQPLGAIPHDTGLAPLSTPLPARTPAFRDVAIAVEVRPLDSSASGSVVLEAEPNNAPEQATDLRFSDADESGAIYVVGGADELEYYNNTHTGQTPDDWYRIEHTGREPKYLSANLQLVEPVVSSRIRFYKQGHPSDEELRERELPNSYDFSNFNPVPYVHPPATVIPGPVPVYTYEDGRAINERAHQQDRSFRTFVTRRIEPGETYYLRVEANQPQYELQVRMFDPAPYDDPVEAVRQAVHYHLAEIDAWLIHRPRNIALHRRVRDATALFGENCMSCHTQSAVWGVADAFRNGYGPVGVEQNYRRLVNTMYESLRLTNELKHAAVNTSVAPNDLGDGPAGTRVAGRNIVLHERTHAPKKLHAHWQRRTANYILQTADPKGINAAGRGSNFGPNVVFKFAAEVLERAWRDSGDPRYFFGIEEKGRKILATGDDIRVTDDYGHRIEFVHRVWPKDYAEQVRRLTGSARRIELARSLDAELRARAQKDIQRLLALQREDGGWGFEPGKAGDEGQWLRPESDHSYPAATAVALIALESAGYQADHPAVKRGVRWLLRNQYPYGLWNAAAATGFVTTAYAIRALSRLHPYPLRRPKAEPRPFGPETFMESLARARTEQAAADPSLAASYREFAASTHPQLRYYGLLGLGAALAKDSVGTLVEHLGDPVKACREAALWSLRQVLLDGSGWDELFSAYRSGDDRVRQSVMQALVTRAHMAGAGLQGKLRDLSAVLTSGMVDRHPGVRAYAFKAAWHWWVWNPEVRDPLSQAWIDALVREEPEAHVAMALRYSTISLFIVNGQVNNITRAEFSRQQYPELASLFEELAEWRRSALPAERTLLDRRLAAMAASHYMERANQQSPGQFAYSTPGATELFGEAVLAVYQDDSRDPSIPWRSIALEGARNITHKPLQDVILGLLLQGDPESVAVAARALSNPGELSLRATVQTLSPLLAVLRDFAGTGRQEDAEALAGFLSRVSWDFEGVSGEQEAEFYRLLLSGGDQPLAEVAPPAALFGKPAAAPGGGGAPDYVPLVARILGENRSLHRREAFNHLSADPRLWLDSTEWMVAYREGGRTAQEAVEGAIEAEELRIEELTFGRTTEQAIPGGVASDNAALIWEEGKVGAHVTFAVPVPEPGQYELIGSFLYGASHGIARVDFGGEPVLDQMDFYRREVTSTGPMRLGTFEIEGSTAPLTVTMLGTNPEAEPELKFGLDFVKLAEPVADNAGTSGAFEETDAADPVAEGKRAVVAMFVKWFSPTAGRQARDKASLLAASPTLRRNPDVRRAVTQHVDSEPVARIRTRLRNLLETDGTRYREQLRELIVGQSADAGAETRPLTAADDFLGDILHFRDYVFPEMARINPSDNRACITCHGVPGRVPTLYLNPPDDSGHIGPAELLENYRKLQARVDLEQPERSILLRKPLNVQTGQEEGHQGGVRFVPEDEGYRTLREWALKQARLQRPAE